MVRVMTLRGWIGAGMRRASRHGGVLTRVRFRDATGLGHVVARGGFRTRGAHRYNGGRRRGWGLASGAWVAVTGGHRPTWQREQVGGGSRLGPAGEEDGGVGPRGMMARGKRGFSLFLLDFEFGIWIRVFRKEFWRDL